MLHFQSSQNVVATRSSRRGPVLLSTLLLTLVLTLNVASASTLPNPDPFTLADDDGSQVFLHGSIANALLLANPLGATIAMFFVGESDGLIPLFIASDEPGTSLGIDFDNGTITSGGAARASFTPRSGPLALLFAVPGATPADTVLFTSIDALNPGGADLMGSYRTLDDLSIYSLMPMLPIDGELAPIATFIISGLQGVVPAPVAAVPLPAALGPFALALALAARRRRVT